MSASAMSFQWPRSSSEQDMPSGSADHSARRAWSSRVQHDESLAAQRRGVIQRLHGLLEGQSFREFAERLGPVGFSHESVRRYIRGQGDPPLTFVLAVVRATGVNPVWLLLGDGSPTWESAPQDGLPQVPMASLLAELATRLDDGATTVHRRSNASRTASSQADAVRRALADVVRAGANSGTRSPGSTGARPASTGSAADTPPPAATLGSHWPRALPLVPKQPAAESRNSTGT